MLKKKHSQDFFLLLLSSAVKAYARKNKKAKGFCHRMKQKNVELLKLIIHKWEIVQSPNFTSNITGIN